MQPVVSSMGAYSALFISDSLVWEPLVSYAIWIEKELLISVVAFTGSLPEAICLVCHPPLLHLCYSGETLLLPSLGRLDI